MENQTKIELTNFAIDKIKDSQFTCLGAELHHEIFNTDYYIIGNWKAEKWLVNHTGVFAAISDIKEYEKSNFGEVNTDLSSSEKVCNMITYIYGEEILQDSKILQDNWDNHLTPEILEEIIKELKENIE